MSKFEQVLSEADLLEIYRSFDEKNEPYHVLQLMRAAINAAMSKLAEQEPVTEIDCFGDTCCPVFGDRLQLKRGTKLYAHPMPSLQQEPEATDTYSMCAVADSNYAAGMLQGWNLCVADDEEKFLIIRENRMHAAAQASRASKSQEAASEKQTEQEPVAWSCLDTHTGIAHLTQSAKESQALSRVRRFHVSPLYAHPMPCVSTMSDKTACVSENVESEMQHHLEYLKRYQKWRRGEDKTMTEAGITPKQLGESLDWLIGVVEDHIPDIGQMVPKGWFCAKERLPEIVEYYEGSVAGMSDTVLTYTIDEEDPDGGRFCAQWLRKGGQGDLTALYWNGEDDNPDYWMPLPAAPKYTGEK